MDDLRAADVDFLTIGQYLQPTPKHHPIDRFITPEEFASYKAFAYGKGFLLVASSPLTRSSYHADAISPHCGMLATPSSPSRQAEQTRIRVNVET